MCGAELVVNSRQHVGGAIAGAAGYKAIRTADAVALQYFGENFPARPSVRDV